MCPGCGWREPCGTWGAFVKQSGTFLDAGNSWNLDVISLSLSMWRKPWKGWKGTEGRKQAAGTGSFSSQSEGRISSTCLFVCEREREKVCVFRLCLCVWSWQIVSWQIPLLRTMELTRPNLARDKYPKLRAAVENTWVWGLAAPRRSLGCGHLIECL